MRFAITGSTGLIGTALTRELRARGHDVTRIVRSYSGLPHGERAVVWHPDQDVIDDAGLEGHDVVIHLAAESLFGVWTGARKRRIRDSRARGTGLLARSLARLQRPPRTLVSASGVHYYGDTGDRVVDEAAAPGDGFLAGVVQDWEAATAPASQAGIRVVHMRSGVVMSADGGMLQPLLPLFRLGLGGDLGDGSQFLSWIAIADITPAMLHLVEHPDIEGPVNFVAPEPVRNREFTTALARAVHRPSFLALPKFAARLVPGGMGEELMLSSIRAIPRKLLDSGYPFRFPTLLPALQATLE